MAKAYKYFLMAIAFILMLSVSFTVEATFWKKDKTEADKQKEIQQERADIRKMAKETLSRLPDCIKCSQGPKKRSQIQLVTLFSATSA